MQCGLKWYKIYSIKKQTQNIELWGKIQFFSMKNGLTFIKTRYILKKSVVLKLIYNSRLFYGGKNGIEIYI